MEPNLELYQQPTYFINSDHPDVKAWALEVVEGAESDVEKAIRLYYDVRDRIFYNPYRARLTREWFRASRTLEKGRSYCVPKAILLAAGARAAGVACRLGFADVRNHITSESLLERLGCDIFAFHGYVEFFLKGKWVKASPTFNLSLCAQVGVNPLDFDGENDAIFQEYNLEGDRYMEYVTYHGSFADLPHKQMVQHWQTIYPHLFEGDDALELDGDLLSEIQAEQEAAAQNTNYKVNLH